jgi:hypothetical protein
MLSGEGRWRRDREKGDVPRKNTLTSLKMVGGKLSVSDGLSWGTK